VISLIIFQLFCVGSFVL